MAGIEKDLVCVVKAGRRAGEQVTITKVLQHGFVNVQGKGGKERKYSIKHLEPVQKSK